MMVDRFVPYVFLWLMNFARKASLVLLLYLFKGDFYYGDCVGIVLLLAFEFHEIVVGAAFGGWKLSAHCRSRVIDRTAARLRVDKLASDAEQLITLATQHPFLRVDLCETRCRHFFGDAEVFS